MTPSVVEDVQATAAALDGALRMARRGFRVLPCRPKGEVYTDQHGAEQISDGKHPDGSWTKKATTLDKRITGWFERKPGRSYGLVMGDQLPNGRYSFALDVDMKRGLDGRLLKNGEASLKALCEETGVDSSYLASTLTQLTPSGQRPDGKHEGGHLIFSTLRQLGNSTDKLGPGLDTRGAGGFIVGPGSVIDGKAYAMPDFDAPILELPEAIEMLLEATQAKTVDRTPLAGIDPKRAEERAKAYLLTAAPAIQGDKGDNHTFVVAAICKDYGCSPEQTHELLAEHWNPRNAPPWDDDELMTKVRSAFKSGQNPPGIDAPEAIFSPTPEQDGGESLNPLEKLNKRFAFVRKGAFILEETTDAKGQYTTEHHSRDDFNADMANAPFNGQAISKEWLKWRGRRTYDGIVFAPLQDVGPRWINLWRGFRVAPEDKAHHPALDAFLEHARLNVCGGNADYFRWLMGWFAHLVQRPWEKPLVALVMKGRKGSGKNALVERVGWLLGPHFLVAEDERYLLSNFNSHLENCLFEVLDEVIWSGDKKAEGRLKGLITGTEHNIERKGQEPYRVANLTRVAIISNEDWVVPATVDERRFAVFNVGDGRLQDRKFFQDMREGMEQGGYAHLLRYLLDFNLSTMDVNDAPRTKGLVDQILAGLSGPDRWLYEAAESGDIGGHLWPEDEELEIAKSEAFGNYQLKAKQHPHEFRRAVVDTMFWRKIYSWLPKVREEKRGTKIRTKIKIFPPLRDARLAIDKAMGSPGDWSEREIDTPKITNTAEDIFS